MKHLLFAAFLGAVPTTLHAAEPLTFTEHLEIEGYRFPVFMELYLEPASRTKIDIKAAGNLRALQVNLPGLLSGVIVDECDQKVTLQLDSATPEGDHIRILGRVQLVAYRCNAEGDFGSRRRTISNITEVDALLDGQIRDDCLYARLEQLTVEPSGLIGGVMTLLNLTERVSGQVRKAMNAELNDQDMCVDIPEPLQALDTTISRGGFRDFGDGHLGFVIQGSLDLNARGVIDILEMLPELGGETCDCE